MASFLCLTLLCLTAAINAQWYKHDPKTHWHYRHDPKGWPMGDCQSTNRQSPVKLSTKSGITCSENLGWINIDGFRSQIRVNLVNSGKTLVGIGAPGENLGRISVTLDNKKYLLKQFHFHWSGQDSHPQGSEHSIDGAFTDVEMHLVFTEADTTLEIDSIAILAVLIKADSYRDNWKFAKLFNVGLSDMYITKMKSVPGSISLGSLLYGVDFNNYFRYEGSMTTPPCSENVKWTVFRDPISISKTQLEQLRSLIAVGRTGNFRIAFDPTPGNKVEFTC
ncbi:carbonic anhydrase 6-like [Tubulanus polymorphus]|uniref:carbonic anhydrase 6-like n=1 Tax=Tubulanus polymorphus TaxID=672921 RepID=UPI003DA638D3